MVLLLVSLKVFLSILVLPGTLASLPRVSGNTVRPLHTSPHFIFTTALKSKYHYSDLANGKLRFRKVKTSPRPQNQEVGEQSQRLWLSEGCFPLPQPNHFPLMSNGSSLYIGWQLTIYQFILRKLPSCFYLIIVRSGAWKQLTAVLTREGTNRALFPLECIFPMLGNSLFLLPNLVVVEAETGSACNTFRPERKRLRGKLIL